MNYKQIILKRGKEDSLHYFFKSGKNCLFIFFTGKLSFYPIKCNIIMCKNMNTISRSNGNKCDRYYT